MNEPELTALNGEPNSKETVLTSFQAHDQVFTISLEHLTDKTIQPSQADVLYIRNDHGDEVGRIRGEMTETKSGRSFSSYIAINTTHNDKNREYVPHIVELGMRHLIRTKIIPEWYSSPNLLDAGKKLYKEVSKDSGIHSEEVFDKGRQANKFRLTVANRE